MAIYCQYSCFTIWLILRGNRKMAQFAIERNVTEKIFGVTTGRTQASRLTFHPHRILGF